MKIKISKTPPRFASELIKQEMTCYSIFNPTSIIMDFLRTLQSESRYDNLIY